MVINCVAYQNGRKLADIDVVGEAGDGEAGVGLVLDLQPDVVLMDLRMPRVDGIEATRRILAAGSPTRVLVLTTFEGEELTFRALQAGAAGYLLKDAGGARLVAAVEAAAASARGCQGTTRSDRQARAGRAARQPTQVERDVRLSQRVCGAGVRRSGHEPELEHGEEAARPRYALSAFGSWCCSAARRPRGKSMPSVLIL